MTFTGGDVAIGAAVLDRLVAVRRIVGTRVGHVDGWIGQRCNVTSDAVRFAEADGRPTASCKQKHKIIWRKCSTKRQIHM